MKYRNGYNQSIDAAWEDDAGVQARIHDPVAPVVFTGNGLSLALALALAAWAIALAAIQILKQPIPIALPLDQPLPVRVVGDLRMDALREPLRIRSAESLRIEAAETLPVQGAVDVKSDVDIQGDVDVAGDVGVEEVKAPVSVQGENGDPLIVSTSEEKPLQVSGAVGVNEVGGKINVQIRDAAKSLLPIP